MSDNRIEYAGFWLRVGASLIDTLLLLLIIGPLLAAIYGWNYFLGEGPGASGPLDILINWVLPAFAVIVFWLKAQATPGKMALSCRVLDAKTGNTMSIGQALIRYLGYFVSIIPLGLGLIWVGIDARKQGWHDKMAGTVVVRSKKRGPDPVRFDTP